MTKDVETNKLSWTGERLITDIGLGKGVIEHLHRYAFAIEQVKNKTVLDIASGEGYGTKLLANVATFVYGIDLSESAIIHAKAKYKSSNLEYLQGSILDIPLENGTIDVVVSFETLEHLSEQEKILQEIRRVLKPNGFLIISTPERENYNKVDPNNPFHVKELNFNEFSELLSKYFTNLNFYHQSYLNGTLIYANKVNSQKLIEYNGDFNNTEKTTDDIHLFNIAICCNEQEYISKNTFSYFNGVYLLEMLRNDAYQLGYKDALNVVRNSVSYKLGQFFINPFRRSIKK